MPESTATAAPLSLADPTSLEPFRRKPKSSTTGTAKPGEELLQVIVETPRGSRNKYSYDEEQRIFVLKTALPAGMVFPYDFGFVPQTVGGDGDPLDVLIFLEEPCFPGCALPVRLLGAMTSEQTEQDKSERNDRLIAVADATHLYSAFQTVDDLPETIRTEISEFFSNYHSLQRKQSRTLAWEGPEEARRLIEEARERARHKPAE
jgi:inorganic pyrophosphatase